MKRKLLLSLALLACISVSTFAASTYCLINSFGEQTTLTITGHTGTVYTLSGNIDYRPVGSTLWPCTGTYDQATGTLHYVATNPNPDFCTFFANTVTFDYVRTNDKTGTGTFSNDCGVSGSLDASATAGDCGFAQITIKKGEYGSTGSHKMLRSKSPVPPGIDFKKLVPSLTVAVSPNPVKTVANITVSVEASAKITVNVYDGNGTLVQTLANGIVNAGKHTYTWNLQTQTGARVKSGYYTVKLISEGNEQSTRILVTE